jgi:hypothetical protein
MKERHWNSHLIMAAGAICILAGELRTLLPSAAAVTEGMGNEMPEMRF